MKMQSKKLSQLNSALFYFKAAAWTVELKINVMENDQTSENEDEKKTKQSERKMDFKWNGKVEWMKKM